MKIITTISISLIASSCFALEMPCSPTQDHSSVVASPIVNSREAIIAAYEDAYYQIINQNISSSRQELVAAFEATLHLKDNQPSLTPLSVTLLISQLDLSNPHDFNIATKWYLLIIAQNHRTMQQSIEKTKAVSGVTIGLEHTNRICPPSLFLFGNKQTLFHYFASAPDLLNNPVYQVIYDTNGNVKDEYLIQDKYATPYLKN